MGALTEYLAEFSDLVRSGAVEIYNEFSLQHEFGVFLRAKLPQSKVQFEQNVRFFLPSAERMLKSEIDITVFSPDRKHLQHAIELKFPRNGQVPEQIFKFCADVAFAEKLHACGFASTAAVIFADDRSFYQGCCNGIYGHCRGGQAIHGCITKPTGKRDETVMVQGEYVVHWQPVTGDLKYAVVAIGENQPWPGH
jgi:hypothetical protein